MTETFSVIDDLITLARVAGSAEHLHVAVFEMLVAIKAHALVGAAFVVVIASGNNAIEREIFNLAATRADWPENFEQIGPCFLGPFF
jgi:hypothetical protein